MNRLIAVLLIFTLFISCQNVDSERIDDASVIENDFKEVEDLVQKVFDDIWGAKKVEKISEYHANDFIILEHGEVWDNETIANWCVKAAQRDEGIQRINSFDFFKKVKEGNRIWMAYHNYATFKSETSETKRQWLESIVAVKEKDRWQLEMMHSTRVPMN